MKLGDLIALATKSTNVDGTQVESQAPNQPAPLDLHVLERLERLESLLLQSADESTPVHPCISLGQQHPAALSLKEGEVLKLHSNQVLPHN